MATVTELPPLQAEVASGADVASTRAPRERICLVLDSELFVVEEVLLLLLILSVWLLWNLDYRCYITVIAIVIFIMALQLSLVSLFTL